MQSTLRSGNLKNISGRCAGTECVQLQWVRLSVDRDICKYANTCRAHAVINPTIKLDWLRHNWGPEESKAAKEHTLRAVRLISEACGTRWLIGEFSDVGVPQVDEVYTLNQTISASTELRGAFH